MHASTVHNRIVGNFRDLDSQSLRTEIETLRDLVKVLAPIAEIFSGLMSSTIGAARSSANSMLFPLIAMGGLLASDVVNNPASSYNKGETLVEKAQALDQRRNDLSAQAKALVELDSKNKTSGTKKVPPRAKQFVVEDGLGVKTLEKNERTAAKVNERLQRVRTKARGNAEKVIEMTDTISEEGQKKLVGLKEAKNNAQVAYDTLVKSLGVRHSDTNAAQTQLQTATKREQLVQAIINKQPNITNFNKIDSDVNQVIQLEKVIEADKKLANSRPWYRAYQVKADNERVNKNIQGIDAVLKDYGLSRSLLRA